MKPEQIQKLIQDNQKERERLQKEIEEAEQEIQRLEPDLELEEKLFETTFANRVNPNHPETKEIASQVRANIEALKSMIVMEQNRLVELRRDRRIAELREATIKENYGRF